MPIKNPGHSCYSNLRSSAIRCPWICVVAFNASKYQVNALYLTFSEAVSESEEQDGDHEDCRYL